MTPRIAIVPFEVAHLDAAAELLAARQRRLRARRAEVPAAFTHPDACRSLLAPLLDRTAAHGVVALRGDEPIGFLLGHARSEPIWGRACWSPIEGSALADGVDAEVIRDLYAAWSQHYVRQGYFLQYVHAAVDEPELMAAWFRTGFGQMQAHAVRDLSLAEATTEGATIRQAVPADIDAIEPLLPLIAVALARPPAYAIRLPGEIETYRESWLEELGEPEAHHFLAEEDGRALAMASFYAAEPGPMVPDGAWELAVAMTLPEARGRGLMRALCAAGFEAARDHGAGHCITDWRSASLPTHRSWTSLGFAPTHYRLHRHIDERIAWADPSA